MKRARSSALAAVAVAAMSVVLPTEARAGDEAADAATRAARDHFERGRKLFHKGAYKEAIVEFDDANRIKPHAANYYNMAQCYEKLGDIPNAVLRYEKYLRTLPDAPDRAIIEGKLTSLKSVLRATPTIGFVRIDVSEEAASVLVDGTPVGVTPLDSVLELDGGEHTVLLRKEGYVPWVGRIRVEPGVSTVLAATLVRADAPKGSGARTGAWMMTGVAGGFLLVGASLGTGAVVVNGGFRNDGIRNPTAVRLAVAADVAYGVTALAGVTSLLLWITSAARKSKERRSASSSAGPVISPVVAPGAFGLSVSGSL